MQKQSEAERHATTGPAAGFDEGSPGEECRLEKSEQLRYEEGRVIQPIFDSLYLDFNVGKFRQEILIPEIVVTMFQA